MCEYITLYINIQLGSKSQTPVIVISFLKRLEKLIVKKTRHLGFNLCIEISIVYDRILNTIFGRDGRIGRNEKLRENATKSTPNFRQIDWKCVKDNIITWKPSHLLEVQRVSLNTTLLQCSLPRFFSSNQTQCKSSCSIQSDEFSVKSKENQVAVFN